jgi:hypothetical protein
VDNRLFKIGTERPGRLRQQDLSTLASALVGYWKGFGVVDAAEQRNIRYVRLHSEYFDILVTGEDWIKILPALGDGTLWNITYPNFQVRYPSVFSRDFGDPILYSKTLAALLSLFPDVEAYPTQNPTQGFTPLSISGLFASLDASRPTAVSLSGNQVTVWKDWVRGQNAYQSNPTFRPIYNPTALNGLPGIIFNGTAWLDFPLQAMADWTIFVVAKYQVSATNPVGGILVAAGYEGLGSGLDCYVKQNDNGIVPLPGPKGRLATWLAGDFAPISPYNPALSANTFKLLTWTQQSKNPGGSRGRIGSGQDVDFASLFLTPPYDLSAEGWDPTRQTAGNPVPILGAIGRYSGTLASGPTFYFEGTLCELLIYDRLLDSSETSQLTDYLNQKWGGALL